MVIVSQDKKVITNFDNTLGIQIEENIINADGEKDYGIETITEKRTCGIGIYATEERAKEVLQEIVELYRNQVNKYHYTNVNNVYEMPKE